MKRSKIKTSHKTLTQSIEELQREAYRKELAKTLNIPEESIDVQELYIDDEGTHHYTIKIRSKNG